MIAIKRGRNGGREDRAMAANSLTRLAVELATVAHQGQCDKAGQPYIGHLQRVASYVDPHNIHAVAAALLHDSIEDTTLTAADLAALGIPPEVIEVVELLTRHDGQLPTDYYTQIRQHRLAREIKLADLADNTDPDRLAMLPKALRAHLQRKYANAYQALGVDPDDGHRRRASSRRVPS